MNNSSVAVAQLGGDSAGEKSAVTRVYRFDDIESQVFMAESRAALFSEKKFKDAVFSKMDELLPEDGVLSLDIFDTLLLRDNSSELTRFFEIGKLMASFVNDAAKSDDSLGNVQLRDVDGFIARQMGTKSTYRASKPLKGCREGSLSEIHTTASRIMVGSEVMKDAFINIELDYESTRLAVNDLVMDYVLRHKARGGMVILISDMYMHADQISDLLQRLDVDLSLFDHLFSSADTKVSKASGGIFSEVEKVVGDLAGRCLHVGDSFNGDFKKPKQYGWNALHLPVPQIEVELRRKDHLLTQKLLSERYGYVADVAIPK